MSTTREAGVHHTRIGNNHAMASIDPRHERKRSILRILGPLLFGWGLSLCCQECGGAFTRTAEGRS